MDVIQSLKKLPSEEVMGSLKLFCLPLEITVAEGSFLHIGGTPSPLTEKKQPVFSVDGQPVIPASSFKGAFRQQVEMLLIDKDKKAELSCALGLIEDRSDLLKPSIPSDRPSIGEQDLFNIGYRREHSTIRVDEKKVSIPPGVGLCPVSYFFGASGLEGFLRIPNFFSQVGEWSIDQTRIRIDRKSRTAAHGAIVSGEQVKPGSTFTGRLLIFRERHGANFGRCRKIGGTEVDLWLKYWQENNDINRQLFLINQILIPALNNIKVLGGQKSLGGGRVDLSMPVEDIS
jgi:CRISPR/Cas system CSM-associated protein Csm3 (group 7 of RAMP superfamily)